MEDQNPNFPWMSYTDSFPKILRDVKGSIAVTTYQNGKLLFLSSKDGRNVRLYGKNFKRPMGISIEGDKMAIATRARVFVYKKFRKLSINFLEKRHYYDGVYLPRLEYYTGYTDIHDLEFGKDNIYAVNTAFSVISKIDDEFSFSPYWKPEFISDYIPEDRCHLNGMAMRDGKPRYATMFSQTDTKEGWRETKMTTGLLMDIENNQVLVEGLPMPHSPKYRDGKIYFLLSATGSLMCFDIESNTSTELTTIDGFVRGMAFYGKYLFVGLSQIRKSGSVFIDLEIKEKANFASVKIIDSESWEEVGSLIFYDKIREIYDIKFIPDMQVGRVVDANDAIASQYVAIKPDIFYWQKLKNQ
jgi:uncharacterized protein (TIGR03032 family)